MTIGLASDHAGFALKSLLVHAVAQMGHRVFDGGTNSEDPVDYPPIVAAVARRVASGELDRAIVVCGSGIGASIVANKIRGVRCALCHDPLSAELARLHNDANVLALGGRLIGPEMARRIVRVWVETSFEGGRHERRLLQIEEIERGGGQP